jgi:NADPH2:quinone reductase
MAADLPAQSLELHSLVTPEGSLELSLVEVPVPEPQPEEVLVRIEAAPINPSDLGLLLAGADPTQASYGGSPDRPVVTIQLDPRAMRALSGRLGLSLAVGNEGAGVVVAAGSGAGAQALIGRTVALAGGAMYSQYRCVPAAQCLELPVGASPKQGASSFVNPMTTLGMVGTLRREGHRALIHTAAASNLGQMLVKLCIEEEIPLINVVRRPEQAKLLEAIGAVYVCDSSSESFMNDLTAAISETGATLAFDAIGGGTLASQILACMEVAASASATNYSRYGSTTHKQVYIYGSLDTSPTVLTRSFGFAWGMGGWLVGSYLQSIGAEEVGALRQRVASELTTTFASSYTNEVSLSGALEAESIAGYSRRATGEKYLVVPSLT